MAYTYNGDMANSVLEVGQAMYDKFINEQGNFITGDTIEEGNVNTWTDTYIGIGKTNFYYYRYYGALSNGSGAADDYTLLFEAFRTPFNINDDMVRPFFMKPRSSILPLYSLYVGVKQYKKDWNFTSNRYGEVNNSIDISLLNNTNWATRLLRFNIISGSNSDNTVNCTPYGKEKTRNFSVDYYQNFDRYILDISQGSYRPSVYSYGYGYNTDDENFYAYTQDTNIPCFNEDDIQGIQNWIDNGDRSSEIIPPSSTKTDFKLWIKGLDAPTYKLNWHNEALENDSYDFSNSKIYMKLSSDSGGAFLFPFKELEYNDGSVKFTWYDMDNEAQTNIFYPWLSLLMYAVYVDENGEEHESGYCNIKLRQKTNNFDNIYELGEQGNDGSIITVVNYDDDPGGFDDDDDDYHDPSDNEDDTPDDSTDISVSGEVCKTFKIDQIELKKLSQFLWTSGFFDNILLVNNSPIENIISLKALIGTVTTTGTSQALTLGNVTTTANAIPCNESITINVGSITLPRKYNNFLDFEPYTKVQIYLPFYGCAMLDSSLVIGRTITIKYIIDVITATAKIKIIHDNKTLYEFKTTCGSDLPITSSNRASVEMGYLSSGVGMGISIASGNVLGGLASGLSMAQSQYHSSTSGNVSGVLNFHDSRMITVLVDRPVYTELRNFNKTHGRMCNLSKTLSNLRGFTKCAENVQIPFNCLDEERTMIIEQLVNGVII